MLVCVGAWGGAELVSTAQGPWESQLVVRAELGEETEGCLQPLFSTMEREWVAKTRRGTNCKLRVEACQPDPLHAGFGVPEYH